MKKPRIIIFISREKYPVQKHVAYARKKAVFSHNQISIL